MVYWRAKVRGMDEYDVVILPSFAQVETWLKGRADEHARGTFAQTVTTFDAWVADLWELHGDGRRLVGPAERQVIMRCVMGSHEGDGDLRGLVKRGSDCMRECAGASAFEGAIEAVRTGGVPDGLADGEAEFLADLARYEDALGELGLIEPGRAAMWLAARSDTVFAREANVFVPMALPMRQLELEFYGACAPLRVVLEPAPGADMVERAPEGVEVRFGFPSGRLAQPGLVADVVCERAEQGDVVVACKDPMALLDHVEERLAEAGLQVRAQGAKPFASTDFGRAYLGVHRCLHDEPWDPQVLSDVVRTPFAGFSPGEAQRIDSSLRADRIARREDVFAELRVASEPFSQLEELADDPDADVLVGTFEQMAQASASRSAAWKAEQLSAMRLLRDVSSAARRMGGGAEVCADVLAGSQVQVSAQVDCEEDRPAPSTVTILSQDRAAALPPGCCATLVVADLTSTDYPVASRDDAAATLLGKLGVVRGEDELSRARRQFNALMRLPLGGAFLVRPLGDENADETYPCVALEEFVDAYRTDPSATDDIDNPYRIPPSLQEGMVGRGEELLFANMRAAGRGSAQPASAMEPWPDMADLAGTPPDRIVPPRKDAQGRLVRKAPSPSQIEVYLECPFQWFAQRRLRASQIDEGFGPLERGTFAHAALERFYREFQGAGFAKVNEGNIAEARGLMREVLSDLVAAQPEEEPLSGRLVPATELERREAQALCEQLVGFLDYEARLLPTFRPAYFEYEIDAGHAVDYAGFSLVGKVDRIDVDDAGRAVIIDYKGSVNAEHEIAGKTRAHPGKVQARVYARAVERALGLDVVGALYVGYGKRPTVAGAYDPRVLDAPHLPNMSHEKCACGFLAEVPDPVEGDPELASLSFGAMLDETERIAGDAITAMFAGEIAPNPSYAKACQHCPVLTCERRR